MKIASAYIEITNLCNLDCASCYNRSGKNLARFELSFDQISGMARRLEDEFGCHSILLAGGEPTVHREFARILSHLLAIPGMQVGVVTNGTTGCQALVDAFHTHENLRVQVSLDGSCEEINARTRGKGHFSQAMAFLDQLRACGREPMMKTVLSKNNLSDLEAYYRLAVSLGCAPVFDFINDMGNAAGDWPSLAPSPQEKLAVLRTIDRLNAEFALDVKLPYCTALCPLADSGELSVLIKPNGSLHPCQMLYDDAYALGNLLTDDADTLSRGYARLVDLAKERRKPLASCLRCVAHDTCRRGCMAVAVMKTGDPLAHDGECTFRKLQLLGFQLPKQTKEGTE